MNIKRCNNCKHWVNFRFPAAPRVFPQVYNTCRFGFIKGPAQFRGLAACRAWKVEEGPKMGVGWRAFLALKLLHAGVALGDIDWREAARMHIIIEREE